MNRYLEAVKEFHENFNHPINNQEVEIPLSLRQLRIKLLFEELQELADATDCSDTFSTLCSEGMTKSLDGNNRDKKEELDALCDIQYVLSGAVLAYGYQDQFDEAFEEVQRSNMSKMCNSIEEVLETRDWYLQRDGTETYHIQKGDKYIVLRKSDDKILKNVHYSEADLNKFIK